MRWTVAPPLSASTALLLAPTALAQQLGGARPVDIPIVQILAGLLLCSLAAFAFAIYLRSRSRTNGPAFGNLLRRAALRDRRDKRDGIAVYETRRLSPYADVCRFASGDREFLVVVTASSCTILSDKPCLDPADPVNAEAAQ